MLNPIRTALLLLALGAAPLAAQASGRPAELDDLSRLRDVEEPTISPDGEWVAYTVRTTDVKEDQHQSDLWMTSWDGATTLRLTTTAKESESTPRWSPDGKYLAFLSSRGDENETDQLWLLPRAGGEAERVSELKTGVSDYAWSPDGKRIAIVMEDSDAVAESGADSAKSKTPHPILIDRYYFKEDVTGYLTDKHSHLYLFDLATRALTPLTPGNFEEKSPAWSPDGKEIAFVSQRDSEPDRSLNWDLFVVAADSGAMPRRLTRFEGNLNTPYGEEQPAWSPDGKWIAFGLGGQPRQIYYALQRLAVIPANGGPVRVLTRDFDRSITSPAWSPDSRSLLFRFEDDRAEYIGRVPLDGGPLERVVDGRRVVSEFDVSPGGRIAAVISTTTTLPEVFAVEDAGAGGRALRALSHQNDSLLAALRLGKVEEITFKSKDGTPINGFMVSPPDYEPGHRYPTILRIHGGPVSQLDVGFDIDWQILAAHGYVVLGANPRGSSGRGEKFASAIYADWGNKDAQDVLAAVDFAVSRGIADPARLGVGGWSYGGILTNYVIAQDTRFKAATSGASISNILAGFGTDEYVREYEGELGTPWKNTDVYLRLSFPFLHADRIVTPTLFLCGDKDFNVPLINSEQMYQALKSLGRDTKLVIYPGQYHGLTKPSYLTDRLQRYLDWYDGHLTP